MADEIKSELETNDVEGKESSATDESLNTEEQDNKQEGGENVRIPYDRFKQKVDEANALKEKLAEIEREQEAAKRKELEETESTRNYTNKLRRKQKLLDSKRWKSSETRR